MWSNYLTGFQKVEIVHKTKVNDSDNYMNNSIFKISFKRVDILANEKFIFGESF